MKGFILRRPSPASVIAVAALVVAVGAGSYALAANNTLHACAANKGGALRLAKKCGKGEHGVTWNKAGPTGKTGAPGAPGTPGTPGGQGPAGTARAWVRVSGAGVVSQNLGIPGTSVTHPTTGIYCINAGAYTTANSVAVVTPDYSDSSTGSGATAHVVNGTSFNSCPSGQFGVRTYNQAGALTNEGFTFVVA